ncbi:MAG: SDR family oxidoreductase [Hyphomicrobiaceae bacterium]
MTGFSLFRGERALVTGSASNIGRAIALALAGEGAELVLTDIDEQRNAAVASEAARKGPAPRTITADLSSRDGWRDVIRAVDGGVPHIFVHSACPRRHERDTALAVDEDTFDAMLTTNVRSGFLLGREIGRRMQAEGVRGRLLYITSLHAESPRNLPHYSAAKAGSTMVMKELARALGPAGIRVNAIAPGAIPGGGAVNMDDGFGPRAKIPLQRFGTGEDIAHAALALLSDRFMGYVTGVTLPVDGGLQGFNWIPMPDA